jgi:hypothetical protein
MQDVPVKTLGRPPRAVYIPEQGSGVKGKLQAKKILEGIEPSRSLPGFWPYLVWPKALRDAERVAEITRARFRAAVRNTLHVPGNGGFPGKPRTKLGFEHLTKEYTLP